ncbi:MAG: ABC transporter substrate-binding protein [Anaerolineae bacterium]
MKRMLITILFALGLVACAQNQGPSSPTAANKLTEVTLAMGYIPTIQHAPFYNADKKGYFTQEGLKVNFQWGLEVDGVKLVGAGQIPFALVSGDQIIQARAQGIPIVYVANWYNAFPIEVVSLKDKHITTPTDLVGKKVGVPCLCGASYTAWRALLYSQKIDPASVNVQNIGFTQVPALTQGTVDAVVVYANNEPVQLKATGQQIDEIKVWDYAQLVGNGLATNEETIQKNPDLVRRFVRAMLKGIADSVNNPDEALKISEAAYPDIGGANEKTSAAVLQASIQLWKTPNPGATRLEDWQAMAKFMRAADFIQQDVDASKAFTNDFVK